MRLGVLDIGSNTGHLLVVDAHHGAAPLPAYSYKEPLRLAEHLDASGAVTQTGVDALASFTAKALVVAEDKGCQEMLGFATSAVRDATNSDAVLDHVREQTGAGIEVLAGEDEARLTFLAVRRWFGWSSGRLLVVDIGGGSLEMAAGIDETPDALMSLPLGAGRLTRAMLPGDPPSAKDVKALRKHVRTQVAGRLRPFEALGAPDHSVATSKTFRSLARITGAPPSSEGDRAPRMLALDDLRVWVPKLAGMSAAKRAALPGVSPGRARQLLAGAIVAEATMDLLDIEQVQVCPWALREGIILRRLDWMRAEP
jgi:exopolyphosphatase/guanosine-5'-triphosphate,3'-diphosphate pyrophosphatase